MKTTSFIRTCTMVCLLGIATMSCNRHPNENSNNDLGYGAAGSQVGGTENTAGTNNEKDQLQFAKEAAGINMLEIKMADMAMNRSKNQAVKGLAQTIKIDHQSANDKLMEIASDKGWELPTTLADNLQGKVDELQKASASDFDKQYVDMMVDGHKGAVDKFEKASEKFAGETASGQGGSNVNPATANTASKGQYGQSEAQSDSVPNNNRSTTTQGNSTNNRASTTADADSEQLEAYINETLPVLRKHLQMSERVQGELKK